MYEDILNEKQVVSSKYTDKMLIKHYEEELTKLGNFIKEKLGDDREMTHEFSVDFAIHIIEMAFEYEKEICSKCNKKGK